MTRHQFAAFCLLAFLAAWLVHVGGEPSTVPTVDRQPAKPAKPTVERPGRHVDWLQFPAQQNRQAATPFLKDILDHLPAKYGKQYDSSDPVTAAHETTHGINSHLRNISGRQDVQCLYVGNNRYALLMQDGNMTLAHVGACIPHELRSYRYELYFVKQQKDWNKFPLYVFDEWTAYTNGAAAGLELSKGGSDAMMGAIEFSAYALAFVLACEKHDPQFLEDKQFSEFLASELQRSLGVYRTGIVMPQWRWSREYEGKMKANADMRHALKLLYGDRLTMEMLLPLKSRKKL